MQCATRKSLRGARPPASFLAVQISIFAHGHNFIDMSGVGLKRTCRPATFVSVIGPERTFCDYGPMSAFGRKADHRRSGRSRQLMTQCGHHTASRSGMMTKIITPRITIVMRNAASCPFQA
jgi:hypothetical protein